MGWIKGLLVTFAVILFLRALREVRAYVGRAKSNEQHKEGEPLVVCATCGVHIAKKSAHKKGNAWYCNGCP